MRHLPQEKYCEERKRDGVDLTPFRSDQDVALTLRDLETNTVPVFVDTSPAGIHRWDRVPLSTVPALEPETPDEVRRQREAEVRRDHRLAEREAILEVRSGV